jgi:hypothetical protein
MLELLQYVYISQLAKCIKYMMMKHAVLSLILLYMQDFHLS